MDEQILKAFHRAEQRMAQEKERRRLEAENLKEQELLRERERRRKKRLETAALGATLAFSGLLILFIWYADGKFSDGVALARHALGAGDGAGGQGRGKAAPDCRDPNIANTPQCFDLRRQRIEAEWSGISMYKDGQDNPFSLHKSTDGRK